MVDEALSIWKTCVWVRGKRKITGVWHWDRHRNCCMILLDSVDPVTGKKRHVEVHGDKPEFNGWKLEENNG